MLANPLSGMEDYGTGVLPGGLFASSGSSAGAPAWVPGHDLMNDQGITGAAALDSPLAGGNTHVHVGGLVLLALGGMFAIHFLGFRAMVTTGVGR